LGFKPHLHLKKNFVTIAETVKMKKNIGVMIVIVVEHGEYNPMREK